MVYATNTGSRRRPFPYDMYLHNARLLLQPDADGNLISESSKTLDETAPVDYTYSSANPYRERTSEWTALYGGFGQAVAPEGAPHRYWYAEYADLSVDGIWMLGPAFEEHQESLGGSSMGEVRQFVQALHGVGASLPTLFAICEKGILRRAGDNNWVLSTTPPAGVFYQQAVRFKHRGTTPLDALYVTLSSGNLIRYRGDTNVWETAPPTEGPPDPTSIGTGQARYIERVGDELWVAGPYSVSKCEDDPFVRANWSGSIEVGTTTPQTWVGDQASHITWLKQVDDSLIIFKEDGVYTIDTDGLDHELFPTLRGKNNAYNGRNASVWLDRIWFTYGNQTFTLTAAGTLKADGLEQMLENTSPIRGQWIGGAGHNTWFFYEVYYDSTRNASHLVKHGTWIEESTNQPTPGVAQFAEAHHGALYTWNKRATSIQVVSGILAGSTSGGNDRLYVGFSDGTTEWCVLPQHSPNPATDTAYEFTQKPAYVYLPQHHSQFRADNKLWHGITALGPNLTTTTWVELAYKTDVSNPFAAWEPLHSPEDDLRFTLPGQRHSMSDDEVVHPIFGRVILLRIALKRELLADPEGDGTFVPSSFTLHQTPQTEGIAVHESIRPAFSREFTFAVKLGSFLPRRDGTVDRRRSDLVYEDLIKTCAMVGPINVVFPTGRTEQLTITNYRDQKVARQNARDHTWSVLIKAIQLKTITEGAPQEPSQIVEGLTYATLERYTLGQLPDII